jgi:hypothetical protein
MKALLVAALAAMSLTVQGQSTDHAATIHAPDGGTHQMIENIAILPLMGAPFSAVVSTDWTQMLADGSSATIKNRRIVARDSTGRIFQQRKFFTASGDSGIRALQYTDPNRHEYYDCIVAQRTCYLSTNVRPAMTAMPANMSGLGLCGCAQPHRPGYTVQQEALGQKTIENVEATGSSEITTLPAGLFGNEKAQPIVKEFWYSPQLGVNLVTKRFDPRSGSEDFTVGALVLGDPDPAMFVPPADYRIVSEMVVRQATTQASR